MKLRNAAKALAEQVIVSPISWVLENYLPQSENETVYMHLFLREISRLGLTDIYTPIGGAANYALLFHIVRLVEAFDKPRVLELGAGQSSLLLSELLKLNLVSSVLTLEENEGWASTVSGRVAHSVKHAPLVESTVAGRKCLTYSEPSMDNSQVDILIVDGPVGSKKFSRLGSCRFLDRLAPEKFAIVFDDVHRSGEKQTLATMNQLLYEKHFVIENTVVRSSKHTALILKEVPLAGLYMTPSKFSV